MKKHVKKLALAKETLKRLEESGSLMNVAGGSIHNTVCDGCGDSGVITCPSFQQTCGATYLC